MQVQSAQPQIGRYLLLEQIGRGATGIVYKAQDPCIGRTVAIKVFNLSQGLEPHQVRLVRERFFREAQAAGSLDHPNIVRIFDAGEELGGQLYIVMEYISGPNLEKVIEERSLGLARIATLLEQIASGLDAAHARGIIHRDVKPANILMTAGGTPKVTDFGIARIENSHLTQDARDLGTPAYMAPEQVEGKPLDERTDLFSLGVLCYQLVAGKRPFEGHDAVSLAYQIVHSTPPPVSMVNPEVPRVLDRVMERSLAKDPAKRYASGREFHEAFVTCLSPSGPEIRTESHKDAGHLAPAGVPGRHGYTVLLGLGALAVVAIAPILLLLLRGGASITPPRAMAAAASARTIAPAAGEPGAPAGSRQPASSAGHRTPPISASTPPGPRAAPSATTTITIAHRISRGTLTVFLDGKSILSDEFSKGKWTPFHMTQWSALRVPSAAMLHRDEHGGRTCCHRGHAHRPANAQHPGLVL